jgi:hypothetical protein
MAPILPTQGEFELVSKGLHPAVCCEYKDLGIVDTKYGKKPKGMWVFQVAETNDEGKRKEIRCKFNLSVGTTSKPSKVQKMMGKWRGRSYSTAELENGDVDPEKPVGLPCLIDIEHMTLDDGTEIHYVDSILPPSDVRLEPQNYVPVDKRSRAQGSSSSSSPDRGDEETPKPEVAGAKTDRPPF